MATVGILILVIALFAGAFLLLRTALFPNPPEPIEPAGLTDYIEVEDQVVADHLARVLQFQTLSTAEPDAANRQAFSSLLRALELMYPRTFSALRSEVVGGMSLLVTWPARGSEQRPVLICAHLDTFPAGDTTAWTHPPFAGQITDGQVWGRGALSGKGTLVALLEAIELLLREDFQPHRTFYLFLGHDTLLGGFDGAARAVEMLAARGERLAVTIGSGGLIAAEGLLPGIEGSVALIGAAEKGHLSLRLMAEREGGAAELPPAGGATAALAEALDYLEKHPFRARPEILKSLYAAVGDGLPFGLRLSMANLWLLGKRAARTLSKSAFMNACMRTTWATTSIHAEADGGLPQRAVAKGLLKLLPGDRIDAIRQRMQMLAGQDLTMENDGPHSAWEASAISDSGTEAYARLVKAIGESYPGLIAAPFVSPWSGDARHFERISEQVYRFEPVMLDPQALSSQTGVDERIGVKSCGDMVRFYVRLIRALNG